MEFKEKKLDIISEYPIHQIHERVFKIGKLENIDTTFLKNIVNILNKGVKFVPILDTSPVNILKHFFK